MWRLWVAFSGGLRFGRLEQRLGHSLMLHFVSICLHSVHSLEINKGLERKSETLEKKRNEMKRKEESSNPGINISLA